MLLSEKTHLSPGAAPAGGGGSGDNKGARHGGVASANEDSASPVGRVLDVGGLVDGARDLVTVSVSGRETGRGLVARGGAGSVGSTTLLSQLGTEGRVDAKKEGSNGGVLHFER